VKKVETNTGAPANPLRTVGGEARPFNKRRTSRVVIDIPVTVFGQNPNGKIFAEKTVTLTVNAHGALVSLKTDIDMQKSAVLAHSMSGEEIQCRVAYRKEVEKGHFEIGLNFTSPNPKFWRINFPPEDWNPADRKRANSSHKINAPLTKGSK
jgi:hypothetical protein